MRTYVSPDTLNIAVPLYVLSDQTALLAKEHSNDKVHLSAEGLVS
jgi:hypothetical protein